MAQPTERTGGPAPRAGPFLEDADYNLTITIRKGRIDENPRRGRTLKKTFKPVDGFAVFTAKVMTFRDETEFRNATLISDQIYFKRSKGCPQSSFTVLTNETFMPLLKQRWRSISNSEISKWTSEDRKSVV